VAPDDTTIEAHPDVTGATNGWWRLCNARVDPGDATLKAGSVTNTAPWAGPVLASVWHTGTTRTPGQDSPIKWASVTKMEGARLDGSRLYLPGGAYDVHCAVGMRGWSGPSAELKIRRNSAGNGEGGDKVAESMVAASSSYITALIGKEIDIADGDYLEAFLSLTGSATGTLETRGVEAGFYLTAARI
jgi:hypothetical protein